MCLPSGENSNCESCGQQLMYQPPKPTLPSTVGHTRDLVSISTCVDFDTESTTKKCPMSCHISQQQRAGSRSSPYQTQPVVGCRGRAGDNVDDNFIHLYCNSFKHHAADAFMIALAWTSRNQGVEYGCPPASENTLIGNAAAFDTLYTRA